MTKGTAQRIAAGVSLAGTLFIVGVKLYVIGWLDEPWIVAASVLGIVGIFGFFWGRHELRARRTRRELQERWEARQRINAHRGSRGDGTGAGG